MFAGHCDQIGMLITHIDDNGFLLRPDDRRLGPQQLIGQRMTIWTASGPVPAVIARKPIHLLTDEERKQVVKLEDLWLDIGAKNKDEAAGAGADRRPGDAASSASRRCGTAWPIRRRWTTSAACGS